MQVPRDIEVHCHWGAVLAAQNGDIEITKQLLARSPSSAYTVLSEDDDRRYVCGTRENVMYVDHVDTSPLYHCLGPGRGAAQWCKATLESDPSIQLRLALLLLEHGAVPRAGALTNWDQQRGRSPTVVSTFVRFVAEQGGVLRLKLKLAERWLRRVQHIHRGLQESQALPSELAMHIAVQAASCCAAFHRDFAVRTVGVRDGAAVWCASQHLIEGERLKLSSVLTSELMLSFVRRVGAQSSIVTRRSTQAADARLQRLQEASV